MGCHYSNIIIQLSLITCNSNILGKAFSLVNLQDSPQNNGGGETDQLESWSYTSQLVAEIESTQTQLLSTNYTRKHLRQFLLNIQKQNQASKL